MTTPAFALQSLPPSLTAHPVLAPLLASARITAATAEALPLGLAVNAAGVIAVTPGFARRPAALPLLRLALELAWMRRVPDLPPAASILLAGRAAGAAHAMLPAAEREVASGDPALPFLAVLAGPAVPPMAQLAACLRMLAPAAAIDAAQDVPRPDLTTLEFLERLWPFALPTEQMLVQGGDDRLTLDPETARNRYLCPPWPVPGHISFSSCTASAISPAAFAEAETARQDLFAAAIAEPAETVLRAASDQIEAELLVHCGVEDCAEAVLAASGTDATLLLTGLFAAERPMASITTVLMSPAETGSGVPEAVQGRHFAPCTAAGVPVQKGGAVEGFPPGLAMVSVDLRDAAGVPRAPDSIAADCEAAIEEAAQRGHVVLQAIDGSKTGLAAPTLLALDLLAARFGARLDIVIDACQFRIEPAQIRAYLDRGWPVLLTGSKFFGAPGFCGAVLFPRSRLRRIAGAGRLPGGLGAYAQVSGGTVSRHCAGLLLRWTAALAHMRPFGQLPHEAVRAALERAGAQARAALMRHTELALIAAPRPEGAPWSSRPSVLTFAIRGGDGMLPMAALRPLYLALAADHAGPPCVLGQPVQLGSQGPGGLRIAFSAAQIVANTDLRDDLHTALEKLIRLLRRGQ